MRGILFFLFTVFSIEAYSNSQDTISGYVYVDLNKNGFWDAGEPPLANQTLGITLTGYYPNWHYTITDSSGYYSFTQDASISIYTETIKPFYSGNYLFVPDSIKVKWTFVGNAANNNFGLQYTDTFSDARVFATQIIKAVPGQAAEYELTVNNHGTQTENGQLTFTFDPNFTYTSSNPSATLSGNTLTWNFSNLLPGINSNYGVVLNTNAGALVQTVFNDTALVSIVNHDSFPNNNMAVISDTIVTAYQRNNKTVSPKNYNGVNFQAGDYISYNITFQNTDTSIVKHVWVIDTLNPVFDMSTLYVVAASAPYSLTINGHALRVDFTNINLPDSAVNQTKSHGFFRFLIKPDSAVFMGGIHNSAYIYFDGKLDTCGAGLNACVGSFNINVYSAPEIFGPCKQPEKGTAGVSASFISSIYNYAPPYSYSYNYLWSNGATTPTILNLDYGQYYVTVTDQCNTTAIGMPFVDSIPDTSAFCHLEFSGQRLCPSDSNIYVYAVVCGGHAPYQYTWSNGATGDTVKFYDAPPFNYIQCSVRDSAGKRFSCYTYGAPTVDNFSLSLYHSNCYDGFAYPHDNKNGTGNANVIATGAEPLNILWSTGQTTNQVYGLHSGLHSVTLTDSLGCSITDTFTINAIADYYYNISFSSVCSYQDSITVTYNVYDYQWNPVQVWLDLPNHYGLKLPICCNTYSFPASYDSGYGYIWLTASNDGYCILDSTYWYSYIDNLNAYFYSNSVIPTYCPDSNNVLYVEANGMTTSSYNFQWSTGVTHNNLYWNDYINNLPPGIYSCTVSDYTGCSVVVSDTIVANDSITITNAMVNNISCYGLKDGSIQLSATSVVGQIYYRWFSPFLGYDSAENNLGIGVYNCNIGDRYCGIYKRFSISQPDSFSISDSTTKAGCVMSGGGSVTLNVSGGTVPYYFNWSNGESAFKDSSLAAGTYTCTVTDSNNCAVIKSYTVAQGPLDSLSAVINTTQKISCFGDSSGAIEVNANNGKLPYSYLWNDSQSKQVASALIAGIYTCTVIDSVGCYAVLKDTLAQAPQLKLVKDSVTGASCYGDSTAATILQMAGGTGSYHYQWSNGQTSSIDIRLAAGIYTCTVTDSIGCSVQITDTITQPDSISAIATVQHAVCAGGKGSIQLAVLGGTPGYHYHWSNNVFTAKDSLLSAGTYNCTISDVNGCSLLYIDNSLYSDTLLTPIIIYESRQNLKCYGINNGLIRITPTGGAGGYIYNWSNNEHSASDTLLAAGAYACTITDANGCKTNVNSIALTQPDSILVLANAINATCFDSANARIFLTVSGGTGSYAYWWNNNVSDSVNTNLSVGAYTCTITDANGCTVNLGSIIISQPDSFFISTFTGNSTCFDSADGSISLIVTGGAGNYTYLWSNNSVGGNNLHLRAGNYAVTVTDMSGCSIADSFIITQPDSLHASFTVQPPTCGSFNGYIKLDGVSGGTIPYYINWNNGDTGTTINNIDAGIYNLVVVDNNGCIYTVNDSVPCVTGIEDISITGAINIYPNPASTILNISVSQKQDYELQLRDITGRTVKLADFNSSITLDVADLPRGIYLAEVKARGDSGSVFYMVVLQ